MIKEIFIRSFLFIFLINFSGSVVSQTILPLNHTYSIERESYLSHKENWTHTASKPFVKGFIDDSGFERWKPKERNSKLLTHIINTDNVTIKEENVNIRMNVLMNFRLEQDQATNRYSTNTRGIKIEGELGKKISFFTSYLENQSFFNPYIKNFVDLHPEFRADGTIISGTGVVPGMGRTKPFQKDGYDYSIASGMISFSVNDYINIQFGNHKNFIGDGYRTFLLSDNAFNYPQLKYILQSKNHKWQYTGIHAQLTDLRRISNTSTVEAPFTRKNMVVHYLSYKPWKNLTISYFEKSILLHDQNNFIYPSNKWKLVNPIPILNVFNTSNSINESAISINYSPWNALMLYAQYRFRNNFPNRKAQQYGLKVFNPFNLDGLFLQFESNNLNSSSFFGYPYGHYSQSLDFAPYVMNSELLGRLFYQYKRLQIQAMYSTNQPYSILIKSDLRKRDLLDANIAFVINPKSNLTFKTGYMNIIENFFTGGGVKNQDMKLFYISLSTNLENFYFDF